MFFILALVGLGICFFGIRVRKVVLAIQGLVFGAAIGAAISVLVAGGVGGIMYYGFSSSQSSSALIIIAITALVFAIISATFEKLSVVVNCFAAALGVLMLMMMMIGAVTAPFVIVALILAGVCAAIAAKYHLIAFVLSFSLTGGLLASVGIGGVIYNWYDVTALFGRYVSSGQMTFVVLMALALSAAGFFVQYRHVKENLQR